MQCGDCWFIYWSRVTDDELAWGYWYSTSIYYYLIIVVKLVVDTGLSMTNWIYYSTFHLELMCGLFLVYRVDAISRTYGTIFFIFMSAIEDVMLPRLLYNKHIPYVEQVNKRASYNLHNLSSDNRLFNTKIDRWVYHCLPIYFYGATVWGPTLFIWWYVLTCWSSWIIFISWFTPWFTHYRFTQVIEG